MELRHVLGKCRIVLAPRGAPGVKRGHNRDELFGAGVLREVIMRQRLGSGT